MFLIWIVNAQYISFLFCNYLYNFHFLYVQGNITTFTGYLELVAVLFYVVLFISGLL
jgi:hypothetical protein